MQRRGQDDKPTLPRDFKSNRAVTVHTTTTAVQQQCNSTLASTSGLCNSCGAFVLVCVVFTNMQSIPHVKVQNHISCTVGPHPVMYSGEYTNA